jgi:hypothetical protein
MLLALASLAVFLSLRSLRSVAAQPEGPTVAAPLGTALSYQGQLLDNGRPANGSFDFQFIVYDAAVGGSQISGTPIISRTAIPVANGLFTVQLDFGNIFGNSQLFLEVAVRTSGGGNFTPLTPRQEILPAPYARFALNAQNATNAQSATVAQSVPWSGISGKPVNQRQIVIPGNALSYTPSANITPSRWGPSLASSTQEIGFVVPQPADWDKTQPFTVTLHFVLPSAPSAGTLNWRLRAGSTNVNLPPASADSGWDSLDFSTSQDAGVLSFAAAASRTNIAKTQSWSPQFSSQFNTWYFGDGVTTNNDFSGDPLWQFSFVRGNAVANGESYSGALIVVAAEISYVAR